MSLLVDIRKQLGDFCLEIQFEAEHEPLALLGASGCGKSVTLRCIAGVMRPDEGRIVLDGVTLYDSAAKICLPPQKRQVGYLFQQYALFPNMTVRQNIAVAVRDRQRRETLVAERLRQFQLENVADQRPSQISGGQQQRTALARILSSEPRAILLDEPFSALDSYLKAQLELELADTLAGFPGTILWVSHDRGEVYRNCRRVCVVERGHSQPVISLEELIHHPGTEAAARLSGCKNFVAAEPRGRAVFLPDWGWTLECGRQVPEEIRRVGIWTHQVRLNPEEKEGSRPCQVVRAVEDVFSTVVLLQPEGSRAGAPLLWMELDKEVWRPMAGAKRLWVFIPPEEILLLSPAHP